MDESDPWDNRGKLPNPENGAGPRVSSVRFEGEEVFVFCLPLPEVRYPEGATGAERKVIALTLGGNTPEEIAQLRGTSVRTVTTQLAEIYRKAGVRSSRQLAAFTTRVNKSPLPHNAKAVLDPKRFEVTDAVGPAKTHGVGAILRDAAIQGDRARGRLRSDDPHEALEIWKALVQGQWSMVDWFDTDGRRFVLAVPNPPDVVDPRGLTESEMQVVAYASFGHSNKFIAYQLGIAKTRVSLLLSSSMRKLGVQTPAQLVKKMRDIRGLHVNARM